MLEDADLISKDLVVKTQKMRDKRKAADIAAKEAWKNKQQQQRQQKSLKQGQQEREVGYERQGQFDPQSSRPAQALGPFESRLREIFKSIS